MKTYILFALLLASPAIAQQPPDTAKDCEQILTAFAQVKIEAGQAEVVSQLQKAVVTICRRAIEAEKKAAAVPAQTPEEVK